MAEFSELLSMLLNPGEDGVPDSIYDDLSASYTDATSTRDAKIQVSEETVAKLEAELLAAKAANWDLLQQIPVADSGNTGENENNSTSDDSDEIGDDDDFFESEDDK